MKKFFIIFAAVAFSFSATAQNPEQAYFDRLEALEGQLHEAVNAKDYAAAERVNVAMIRDFEAQDEAIRQQWSALIGSLYYNLACMESLQNKRGQALASFAKACESGYSNYGHVKTDTDLDNIRDDETFRRLHQAMREESDYIWILQQASGYVAGGTEGVPPFTYQSQDDADLVRVREYFELDSVAGNGDELSKIRNMLTFVHDQIRHDGQHDNPGTMNAIFMAEACKDGSRGLNCRGLATVLNECYLSMGFKSRVVTCMPKVFIQDCHVINTVYSATLDKWVWVDPTQNAWVMDENGVMLGIGEVRERLRDGHPVVLNDEANWNNQVKSTREDYIDNYMAKNLYYIVCGDKSCYNAETPAEGKPRQHFTALCPEGYTPAKSAGLTHSVVTDDKWFWKSPYEK